MQLGDAQTDKRDHVVLLAKKMMKTLNGNY